VPAVRVLTFLRVCFRLCCFCFCLCLSHVRRTAAGVHETSTELKMLNQECKQRCLDVDDITPLVNEIAHMTHLTDIRLLMEDSLAMITPDTRRGGGR
jgi:hypothetical protein